MWPYILLYILSHQIPNVRLLSTILDKESKTFSKWAQKEWVLLFKGVFKKQPKIGNYLVILAFSLVLHSWKVGLLNLK